MSSIEITYERAMEFCPTEAEQAIETLRRSRSKHRLADPRMLKWEFAWGTQVRAHSFRDLMSGKARADDEARRKLTLEERIADQASRTIVSVCVHSYGARLPIVPDEIMSRIVNAQTESFAEEQRTAALSPEEREAEVKALLQKLSGTPGFVVVKARHRGK